MSEEQSKILRQEISQIIDESQSTIDSLTAIIEQQRQKNQYLASKLIQKRSKKQLNSSLKQIEREDSKGKIIKQRALTPRSTFQTLANVCRKNHSQKESKQIFLPQNSQAIIENYVLRGQASPKEVLEKVQEVVQMIQKKINERESQKQLNYAINRIQLTLKSLAHQKIQIPRKQPLRTQKQSIQQITNKNQQIMNKLSIFKINLNRLNHHCRTKSQEDEDSADLSTAQLSNVLKKCGDFTSYTFDPDYDIC